MSFFLTMEAYSSVLRLPFSFALALFLFGLGLGFEFVCLHRIALTLGLRRPIN